MCRLKHLPMMTRNKSMDDRHFWDPQLSLKSPASKGSCSSLIVSVRGVALQTAFTVSHHHSTRTSGLKTLDRADFCLHPWTDGRSPSSDTFFRALRDFYDKKQITLVFGSFISTSCTAEERHGHEHHEYYEDNKTALKWFLSVFKGMCCAINIIDMWCS